MIYTVTLNPSLDYFVTVHDFSLGKTNRTEEEQMLPGGKGLNVSMVLRNMGIESVALGFVAGFVGQEIAKRIRDLGIPAKLITLPNGNSRINIKLKNIEGTEINGMGPKISGDDLKRLMLSISGMGEGDYLILAGSIPNSVPDSIYKDMMVMLEHRGVEVVVDAAGELLRQVLPYRPFLIKPNNQELGALFGVELQTKEEVIPYAQKLQKEGAKNVLVSMAGEGAVLAAENGRIYKMEAPKGILRNGVGAGDSMVAGFLTGWLAKKDYKYAFQMAVCTGSASAFSEGFAEKSEVEALMGQFV